MLAGRPSPIRTATAAVLVGVLERLYFLFARPARAGVRTEQSAAWAFAVVALLLFAPAAVLNPWIVDWCCSR